MKKQKTVILALLLMLGYGAYIFFLAPVVRERAAVRGVEFQDVDLTGLADGLYYGEYVDGAYEVEVVFVNNRIVDIQMLTGRGNEFALKAEGVLENVVDAQSLQVDLISGATTTSKAILKAVEVALNNAVEREYISGLVLETESERILVVETDTAEDDSWFEEEKNAIWLQISAETTVLAADGTAAELKGSGQQVSAWVVGPILQSYPAQGGARLVVVMH